MIWVILIIALALRLVAINQSLWLDEAININNAAGLSFGDLVTNYALGDFHPPLYHVFLKSWIILFGASEVATRSLSVAIGVLTVGVTYLIGKKLFEKQTATTAAILLATAPLHIYYSQEARMYALAALFASLSVYFFISLLRANKIRLWLGFIAATTLMLYTDYLPYLLIPTFAFYLFTNRRKITSDKRKAFIPAFLLVFIFLIPWLLIFPQQLSTGLSASAASPAWSQVVGGPGLNSLPLAFVKFLIGRISHDNNLTYALLVLPLVAYSVLLFGLAWLRTNFPRSFLWYWFFTPLILGFIFSFFIPVFAYFRFIFLLPALYILWASAIRIINSAKVTRILLTAALLINLVSSAIYFLTPKFQREDWRGATAFIRENADQKSIVLFASAYTMAPFDYYNQEQAEAIGAFSDSLENLVRDKNRVFLFQYLSGITDPQGKVAQNLYQLGFVNTRIVDFPGVGHVYELKR